MRRRAVIRRGLIAFVGLTVLALPSVAHASTPVISGFDPDRATVGVPIVITGANFTGASAVSFDGTAATFSVDSDTQITATVPRGSLTGPVTVVTPDGTATSPTDFTVQPNIVLILTDDQRYDELSMPGVRSALMDKGVTFSNGFVVDPLCCPSRATILTGKYSHGTDIYSNIPPHGGFATFTNAGEDQSTIATWLNDAGYYTGFVGKYLNGYSVNRTSYIPPGWDQWNALALNGSPGGEHIGGYYDYYMSVNGAQKFYGDKSADYSTNVLGTDAVDFVKNAPTSRPLFLYFAPRAPHGPAVPANRDRNTFPHLQPPRPPNYNEQDVSDKPQYIRNLSPLTSSMMKTNDDLFLHQNQSLLRVDDFVTSIVGALRQAGRLDNTLIVFASDNGLALGEHRWTGKLVPYEESIRVPIIARYDALTKGAKVDPHLVANLDFAPTFASAAGVDAPGAEGSSFLPLMDGNGAGWRTNFLVEHAMSPQVPTYCAIRNQRYLYVKYETGEEELYDLSTDPYELDNLAQDPAFATQKRTMYRRLLDSCNPPPPGYTP
ncbi:MAG: sulfatase-like hydrolase/transferase [Actinomycetota bacterium]